MDERGSSAVSGAGMGILNERNSGHQELDWDLKAGR
jgi:hypothetical protein